MEIFWNRLVSHPGYSGRVLRATLPLALLLTLAAPAAGVESEEPPTIDREILHYRWDLGGLLGNLISLFLPGRGDGTLTTISEGERVLTELHVTSPKSADGEFWLYGAAVDPASAETREVWSSYLFRGKSKDEAEEVEGPELLDVVSGIWLLRREPPEESRRMRIWSDGKIYPVEVAPTGRGYRRLAGTTVAVRGYVIHRAEGVPGRAWDGKIELYLAEDEAATPVEIVLHRDLGRIQLRLAVLEDGDPLQLRHRRRDVPDVRGPVRDPDGAPRRAE